jgi:hypothetical protein
MSSSLTFMTRHYPPSPNINGESVWDMAKYVHDKQGVESNVICIDRDFEGGGNQRQPFGNILKINTVYQGKNAILRLIALVWDGFMLTRKALRFKDTQVVVTSSPPLLPTWAALLFSKKMHWAFWAFDLFPEGFAVTDLISERNFLYRWVKRLTYQGTPDFLIALGPKQGDYLKDAFNRDIPTVILPCGVFVYQDKSTQTPVWKQEGKIHLGYCGNVGDAHNPDFIRAMIDSIDPEKHRLILALYGKKAPALKAYAKDKPGVILVDSVPRNQLHFIDVHLVSLTKKWTHIAVPSKAISAVCAGASILFCGSRESDNWHMLQDAGWYIDENDRIPEQTTLFLETLTPEDIYLKRAAALKLSASLQQMVTDGYNQVVQMSHQAFP